MEQLCMYTRSYMLQVDSLTYVSMIVALNETLRQAANPVYGLIDNILAQLTFQLWPFLMGTYYTRVRTHAIYSKSMKKFNHQIQDFERLILHPMGLVLVPLEETAYLYIDCVPHPR